jgi:hypothetical protein
MLRFESAMDIRLLDISTWVLSGFFLARCMRLVFINTSNIILYYSITPSRKLYMLSLPFRRPA